ncbi:MAG: hypothetical protein FWG03_07685 [Clostridiales bacterium]|nr:hypothetical protein [Clostridiales bacterium]
MRGRRVVLAYWAIALCFFTPGAAYAYIDPATTTYIIQIITALVVTVGVSLSIFMYRFRMISAKLRYGLYGLLRRFKTKGDGSSGVDQSPGLSQSQSPGDGSSAPPAPSALKPYAFPDYAIPGSLQPPTEEDLAELGVPVPPGMERIERKGSKLGDPGKRGYFGRMKAALPALLSACLTFILFGCIDLAAQNSMDMPFRLSEAAPAVFACFAACFAASLFVLPLFRGLLYEILLALVVCVLIAGYIQGTFLNIGLGELTGDEILWGAYGGMMAGSAVFWACMAAAVFALWRFAKPAWRGLTVFAPLLLIVIQAVALVPVLGSSGANQDGIYGTEWGGSEETLSVAGIDELAREKNTIVFLLDRLDEEFVDEIEELDPHFFDSLDGFTKFDDNISYYVSTFPSVTAMLTGHRYYFDGPVSGYFDYAWENAGLMHELKARGTDIKLYMARGYIYDKPEQLQGIASNILVPEYDFDARVALVKLLKLSAFRYAPMPAKPAFWLSPTEFADAIYLTSAASPYITNDFAFYDMLTTQRLKKTDEGQAFFFYHLLGAHDPIRMDENIQQSYDSTPARQAMGAFGIVYEYIDQMKALGLYEDATIIITGDHGMMQEDGVSSPALTGLFVKPAGSYGAPLARSQAPVCPGELAATIMWSMFGDSGGFGPTYFDIGEGDPAVREYITNLKCYEITGDGRDFSNWEYTGMLENKSDW